MQKEEVIDRAIDEIENIKKILKKKKTIQINSQEELSLIKATAYSWIKTHHQQLSKINGLDLNSINNYYYDLLNYSATRTNRKSYFDIINAIKSSLISLRIEVIKKITDGEIKEVGDVFRPEFAKLISDSKMIAILERRWAEIEECLNNSAPLSATVMMGGLLEAVLLAKINTFKDKRFLFKQKSTPKDKKTGKAKSLSDWMLKDFIDVSSEAKIITKISAEFSRVVRDYRNYIHPERELIHGEVIVIEDAKLFWVVINDLLMQILK